MEQNPFSGEVREVAHRRVVALLTAYEDGGQDVFMEAVRNLYPMRNDPVQLIALVDAFTVALLGVTNAYSALTGTPVTRLIEMLAE